MKVLFFLSLFALASCSVKTVEEVTPTESDSAVVTPQEVQGCVCTKIFMPVCGEDGRDYPNACEAECYGNAKWTEGNCK